MYSLKRLVRIRGFVAGSVLAVAAAISPGSVAHAVVDVASTSISPVADEGPDIRALMDVHPLHRQARHRARPAADRPAVAIISPCPAYGTVLIPGSRWLGGQGVDVISNGGTGADCYNTGAGHRWQCGELVNRFLTVRRWGPAISGNAGQFYANASGAAYDRHPIGSGYLPVPGDVVVWSGGAGGGFGHAAIVVGDGGGRLTVVEQNSTITGYGSFPIDSTGSIGSTGGLTPVGYLHAKANPNQPPVAPPPPATSPSAPASHHASGGTPRPPAPSSSPSPSRTPQPTPTATPTPSPTPTPTPTATPSSGLGALLGGH